MNPKKSKSSPAPLRSAASLSESASRFSSSSSSPRQKTIDGSPRMANANRYSREALEELAEQEESTQHIGMRDVTKAIGVRTRRKYSLLGVRFGPKVHEFEEETISLPVYRETSREKRYYSATKAENACSIEQNGFQTVFGGNGTGQALAPTTTAQYNSRGHIYFFNNEGNARVYGKTNIDGDYVIVEFVMPETHEFTPDPEAGFSKAKLSKTQAMRTAQSIPADCIKGVKTHRRNK